MDLTQSFPLPGWRHEYQYLMKTWQAQNLQPEQKIQLHYHIIEFNFRQDQTKLKFFHITHHMQTATRQLNDKQNLIFFVGREETKENQEF